tara:strand:+ start:170 stop:919 length:750 start_codon:yes stop_codon:yes gene_type:complete
MPSKKRDWAAEQALRLEARLRLGCSDKRWREQNNLSQQNCHDWAKAAGIPLHNSQVAYWERGVLDPKGEFWYAREAYNFAIAENDFPPGISRTVRDRLKASEPYLNADGEVANAQDFQAMFGGRQSINKIYTVQAVKKITLEHALNISTFDRTVFSGFATDELMDRKDAWKSLVVHLEGILNKKLLRRMQAVVAGQDDWSVDEIATFTNNGTKNDCLIINALEKWTGKKMPKPNEILLKGGDMRWPKLT